MDLRTQGMHALWKEARTRFEKQLVGLMAEDLGKVLPGTPNSVGFLLRHIGDVEFLFARNVFGLRELHVVAKTVIAQGDSGEWTDLAALREYVDASGAALEGAIVAQTAADWDREIETKEFGRKLLSEALGRIVSHTAYHAGQLAMVSRYGKSA